MLQIIIFTHSLNGLTTADFELASALDAIDVDYSPKWARENSDKLQLKA